jgi:hypothetical protein
MENHFAMRRFYLMLLVPLALLPTACVSSKIITADSSALNSYQKNAERNVFIVKGCVYHPGTFSLKPEETIALSEALKKAGGTIPGSSWDSGAYLTKIRVFRINHAAVVAYTLDVWHGTDGKNFPIKAGDQIFVPEVLF